MVAADKKQAKKPVDRLTRVNEEDTSLLFHALGDPTRRAMLDMLSAGPMSVSALAEPLGITLTAVTQHIQVLEGAQLAKSEKLGRVRSCRIEPIGFDRLEQWVKDHRTEWERKLNKLGAMLEEEDNTE